MAISLSRLSLVAICIWLALLLYVSKVLIRVQQNAQLLTQDGDGEAAKDPASASVAQEALQRIQKAQQDIEVLRRQNKDLQTLLLKRGKLSTADVRRINLTHATAESHAAVGRMGHASVEHEKARRRVHNGIAELWYAVRAKGDARTAADLDDQFRTVVADSLALESVDGADEWRATMLQNLSDVVQRRLEYVQNPADCAGARKLLCYLNKGCGFGCQIHHAAYCLLTAYATERTLILDAKGWRYSHKGWTSVFQPLSRSCNEIGPDDTPQPWTGIRDADDQNKVVSLPIIDSLRQRADFLPLAFPADLAPDLLHLHGNPPVWWIGQFLRYIMRYSRGVREELEAAERRLRWDAGPVVGVHVRRTDKLGSEAAFHAIDEYVRHADDWVRIQAFRTGRPAPKRLFLATDDPALLQETKHKYGSVWEVLGSADVAATAQLGSRYSDASLHGVLLDIHLLSRADYLVCTFSSQVSRVAFELMQARRGDAARRAHSLDDVFYFGGQNAHEHRARLSHRASPNAERQLAFDQGDVIALAGNHWDGWSKGRNRRTGDSGLYPSYKAEERWRIVDMPTYPRA